MAEIRIRALAHHQELEDAVRLQRQVWGFDEVDLIPARVFLVATKVGGQVFGAFDDERMVGFCLAIPGIKPGGGSYLHSHMLGVLPEYRNAGVGRMLKLEQRRDALSRGIDLIEWTFDPLELKNAYFNIERLGTIVRRYVFNQYGTTSSHLHGGLPTDRCVAEWWLASPRVQATLAGETAPAANAQQRVSIPANITELRSNAPAEARRIQERIGGEFTEAFRAGLAVVAFERSEESGDYILAPWPN